jgi:hypothetical protein
MEAQISELVVPLSVLQMLPLGRRSTRPRHMVQGMIFAFRESWRDHKPTSRG